MEAAAAGVGAGAEGLAGRLVAGKESWAAAVSIGLVPGELGLRLSAVGSLRLQSYDGGQQVKEQAQGEEVGVGDLFFFRKVNGPVLAFGSGLAAAGAEKLIAIGCCVEEGLEFWAMKDSFNGGGGGGGDGALRRKSS